MRVKTDAQQCPRSMEADLNVFIANLEDIPGVSRAQFLYVTSFFRLLAKDAPSGLQSLGSDHNFPQSDLLNRGFGKSSMPPHRLAGAASSSFNFFSTFSLFGCFSSSFLYISTANCLCPDNTYASPSPS